MADPRDWIASHAYRTPEKLAQIDVASGRKFTYREMNTRVSHLAGHFRKTLGLKVGDVVAVLGPSSSDVFDIDFACGRVGALFFPMNTRLAPPEVAFQLTDAKPSVIFVGPGFEDLAEAAIAEAGVDIPRIAYAGAAGDTNIETVATSGPAIETAEKRGEDDGWTLMYSSGTTGRPKGVLHTHGGVTMQAIGNSVPLGLGPQSVGMTFLPLFHISGLNIFAHAMFYAGATQVTLDKFHPMEVLTIMSDKDYGITHFAGVPTIFEMIAAMPGFKDADLGHIQGAFVGGSPSTEALLNTYAAKGLPLIQGYGLTETGPTLTVLDAADAVAKIGSAGKKIMHVDLMIAREDGTEALVNEVGEIWTRGPSIITEYFNRPEAQATSFHEDWLRTGDMGRIDADGYLFVIDRKKDMIISGGENIYPAEVENCIADMDGVLQVAVIGVPDEKWGEVGAACIVCKPDSGLAPQDVISFCDGKIARYKIPRDVHFLEALPLNASGKVLKTELRKMI